MVNEMEMFRRVVLVGLAALTMMIVFAISSSARTNVVDNHPAIEHQGDPLQSVAMRDLDHHRAAMAGEIPLTGDPCPSECTGGGACCGVIHCVNALAGMPSGVALVIVSHIDTTRQPSETAVMAGIRHAPDHRPPVFG